MSLRNNDELYDNQQELETLEAQISLIRGLINYHTRVSFGAGCSNMNCEMGKSRNQCVMIDMSRDSYHNALSKALELMEEEYKRICDDTEPPHKD